MTVWDQRLVSCRPEHATDGRRVQPCWRMRGVWSALFVCVAARRRPMTAVTLGHAVTSAAPWATHTDDQDIRQYASDAVELGEL